MYLFNPSNSNSVVELLVLARLLQVVKHLSRAEYQLLNRLGVLRRPAPVGNDALELGALVHLVEAAAGLRMPEKALGREQDDGLAEGQRDLAPEQVEVVAGRGAVGDDPVGVVQLADGELVALGREVVGVVRAHLQEALHAGTRVLRTHTLNNNECGLKIVISGRGNSFSNLLQVSPGRLSLSLPEKARNIQIQQVV